jgi:hypothetical protein
VAHGGWKSSAHSRYERFEHAAVLSIPAAMVGAALPLPSVPAHRSIQRGSISRGASGPSSAAPMASPAAVLLSSDEALPVGYTRIDKEGPSGRKYAVYLAPSGAQLPSRVQAWRHFGGEAVSPGTTAARRSLSPNRRAPSSAPRRSSRPAASSDASALPVVPVYDQHVDDLADSVTYFERPSVRRPPPARSGHVL